MKLNDKNMDIEISEDQLIIKVNLNRVIGSTKRGFRSVAKNEEMVQIIHNGKPYFVSLNVWAKLPFERVE